MSNPEWGSRCTLGGICKIMKGREGKGGKCTTNLAELAIYLLLRVQSSSIFNQSYSVKMYFRDFMQRELFVIKSSHTHTHTQRSLTY